MQENKTGLKPWYRRMFCQHKFTEYLTTWEIKGFIWWLNRAWKCDRCGGIRIMHKSEEPINFYYPNEL